MIIQETLLTCHKGVDLHAASALRVMVRRLEYGRHLRGLGRAEFHTFWRGEDAPGGMSVDRLLAQGRYYNPNKHHFVHATTPAAGRPWTAGEREHALPAGWPGTVVATDLPDGAGSVRDRLLGGAPRAGETVVDAVAHPLGATGPLLSGVVWRLRLDVPPDVAGEIARALLVARDRRRGLLVNPWMEAWRIAPPVTA